jgi:hypothetical protein
MSRGDYTSEKPYPLFGEILIACFTLSIGVALTFLGLSMLTVTDASGSRSIDSSPLFALGALAIGVSWSIFPLLGIAQALKLRHTHWRVTRALADGYLPCVASTGIAASWERRRLLPFFAFALQPSSVFVFNLRHPFGQRLSIEFTERVKLSGLLRRLRAHGVIVAGIGLPVDSDTDLVTASRGPSRPLELQLVLPSAEVLERARVIEAMQSIAPGLIAAVRADRTVSADRAGWLALTSLVVLLAGVGMSEYWVAALGIIMLSASAPRALREAQRARTERRATAALATGWSERAVLTDIAAHWECATFSSWILESWSPQPSVRYVGHLNPRQHHLFIGVSERRQLRDLVRRIRNTAAVVAGATVRVEAHSDLETDRRGPDRRLELRVVLDPAGTEVIRGLPHVVAVTDQSKTD